MTELVLRMSMSHDGFITGLDGDKDQGLGRDGHRLHDWLPAQLPPLGSSRRCCIAPMVDPAGGGSSAVQFFTG